MTKRRDILLGIGAGIGSAGLTVVGLATRLSSGRTTGYPMGEVGADVRAFATSRLSCTAGTVTAFQFDGPFYTKSSPRRRDIRELAAGAAAFVLTGRVLDSRCQPIAGAVLDFWQTGHTGEYDNDGYKYRGHQYTDAQGRFELVTIRPRMYTALSIFRTAHIHVKVQGPKTALLTTQLYLPDEHEANARDGGFTPDLAVTLAGRSGDAELGSFDFVLASA